MAYGVLSLILSFLIYAPPLLEDSIVPSTLEAIILFIIAFFELRFLSSLFGILNIYCTNSEREKKMVMNDRCYTSPSQYLQLLSILHLCYAWESKQKRAIIPWSIPALSLYLRVNYLVSRILLLYYSLDV